MHPPEHTASFLGIPAELRLNIYDRAFAPTLVEYKYWYGKKINLAESLPPTKDLLLVCRQIYHEASKTYKKNYRGYWSSPEFCLRNRAEDLATVLSFNDKALDNIHSLEIVEWYLCQDSMELTMIPGRRGWYWMCPCHGGAECVFGYIDKNVRGEYVWNNIEEHLAERPECEEEHYLQKHGLPKQRDLPLRLHLEVVKKRYELFCDETLLPEEKRQQFEDDDGDHGEEGDEEESEPAPVDSTLRY
ncbi:hypothetical protein CLAFUW4_05665 [Fulvia fulva]|uniref:Uncharacterized protein n=1 Tax=Passalora fulva TaxID=5499 RepID=A0A9Q8P9N8_PASFU|nr:uncharacterized protein CLAFUR5_05806 [Fulvia fulva]KAK4623818.1 hypothetical protein CLAFUR4_05659 [Fulvia fulva]KAK4625812.1 hypothetical protein CLAFUR0_05667 [Fulvia fulva]UJO18151.1 hypothetical protein CLAFUR5_05806 [Fulvia fulva]WPV14867.1 hypothetical protein CLAFUW4_05665 [Fulvia fulva]WPV30002.1 hypothetical protein CLAFUW7_05664 [Fulvia fulva]